MKNKANNNYKFLLLFLLSSLNTWAQTPSQFPLPPLPANVNITPGPGSGYNQLPANAAVPPNSNLNKPALASPAALPYTPTIPTNSNSKNSVGFSVNQPGLDPDGLNSTLMLGKDIKMNDLLTDNISKTIKSSKEEVHEARRQVILDLATSVASSAALANKMSEINISLERNASHLDKIFNFSKLILTPGVLPPVLVEGNINYAQNSEDEVRISDKIYKIESKAKFISNYPTWRNYLKMSFASFSMPNKPFDYKNDQEKLIWDEGIKNGWKMGERLALSMFDNAYNRMERDFNGMILFRILQAQGLITPTIIAGANLGVTGGGKEMTINDQVFRITEHSSLNPDAKSWDVDYPVTFEEKDIHNK